MDDNVSALRLRQNGRYVADGIFKCIFFNEDIFISIKILLKCVINGQINNIPAFHSRVIENKNTTWNLYPSTKQTAVIRFNILGLRVFPYNLIQNLCYAEVPASGKDDVMGAIRPLEIKICAILHHKWNTDCVVTLKNVVVIG